MAWKIAFLDGFGHYTTLLDKWDWKLDTSIYVTTEQARTGSRSLKLAGGLSANRSYVAKALNVQAKSACIGFALMPPASGTGNGQEDTLLQVRSGLTNCATVVFNSANKFDLHLHNIGGTKLTGTKALTQGVWYYIELELLIDDTVGAYHLKIDGVTEYSGTGVDTAGSADQFADRVYFWNKDSNGNDLYVDDLYMNASTILETQGSGFAGDVGVRTVLADADGSNVDFTRSGGVTDYENVDEALIDDDTSYLHSATVGHRVTLNVGNITLEAGEYIRAVQACMGVKKADAGFREVKVMAKSGVTESEGASQVTSSTDYHFKTEVWELDPDTAVAWTEAGFNATEFGVEVQ